MSNPGGMPMAAGMVAPVHAQQMQPQQQQQGPPPQQAAQMQQQQQQRMPPNMNPQQQLLYQQQQQQQQQQQLADDQKKLTEMIEGLNLLLMIRDDMNTILDNVAKANPANMFLASKANEISQVASSESKKPSTYVANTPQANQMSTNVPTPASVAQAMSQQQAGTNDQDMSAQQNQPQDASNVNDELLNLEPDQVQFLQVTDTKFLQGKTEEISKNLNDLEKIIKDMQPVVAKDTPEFLSALVDLNETNISGTKFINNFRYITKVQEVINCTALPLYKRHSQTYMDKKSVKYRPFSLKPIKIEELDKYVSSHLLSEIKVKSSQKSENEFVLDIIMPQNFKFVMLLFNVNVEKIQVRPIDLRQMRAHSLAKADEANFDFEHKNSSCVFQKLEESCLYACAYYRAEYGVHHLRYILQWLKHYVNLFNAKCARCEKHLLNCLPPTMRDFRTYEPFHVECLYNNER